MYDESPIQVESSGSIPISEYIFAIILGIVGAIIGGAIWAGVAIVGDVEIGYLAILVGALAGGGVLLGSGQKRGLSYQLISVVIAALGILIGKYITLYHFLRLGLIEQYGQQAWDEFGYSILSTDYLQDFMSVLPETLEILDVLFFGIAIYTAYRIPQYRESLDPALSNEKLKHEDPFEPS